ncbi:hypothetical protein AGMMS49949_06850 [Alphaproteobacteria bacterium]|nr:hypothetical protein AGMMS49949_06850 [Alphaproteobacteria bacterium]GHT00130.1 hypothetical protein AGMMS50296_8400 [Alphaproteobacteria bacterium]
MDELHRLTWIPIPLIEEWIRNPETEKVTPRQSDAFNNRVTRPEFDPNYGEALRLLRNHQMGNPD